MANNNNWGGFRKNSGRSSRKEEGKIIEKLNPLEPKAFEALAEGISRGEYRFVKMWFEYRYGRPTEFKVTDMQISPLENISPSILFKSTEQQNEEERLKNE